MNDSTSHSSSRATRKRGPITPATAARLIRATLIPLGAVATGTGLMVALRGTAGIPGGAPTAASNDSVLRFYAVWWAAQGPVAWRLARDPDLNQNQLRAVCAATFLGGLARLAAARSSGRPHPLFQLLTAAELLLPPVLIALRHRTAAVSPASVREASIAANTRSRPIQSVVSRAIASVRRPRENGAAAPTAQTPEPRTALRSAVLTAATVSVPAPPSQPTAVARK